MSRKSAAEFSQLLEDSILADETELEIGKSKGSEPKSTD